MPDLSSIGKVLQTKRVGKFMQVLLQNPDPDALGTFLHREDLTDAEEAAVNLEDVYAALMVKADTRRKPSPVRLRTGEELENELYEEGV